MDDRKGLSSDHGCIERDLSATRLAVRFPATKPICHVLGLSLCSLPVPDRRTSSNAREALRASPKESARQPCQAPSVPVIITMH